MSALTLTARVYLWNHFVGAIAEVAGHRMFEYAPEYLAVNGPSVSPLFLPAEPGTFEFQNLARVDAFKGLPGVFADSLPDRFGQKLQERFFAAKGILPSQLSPVQQLLYVGERGMGALVYRPAEERSAPYQLPIDLATLRAQAKKLLAGHTEEVLTEIQEAGSSAGGARAKALVGWNRGTNAMVANAPTLPDGYEAWLIKLDGADASGKPGVFGRLEYAYSLMAHAARISMSPCCLIENGDAHHFATRRFDREGNARVHYISLAGLQHADFNTPRATSYESYLTAARMLGLSAGEQMEAFARMVFNVVCRNQDDHPKNFGFLMRPDGAWSLAPAFDLTYANGKGFTASHQMTIGGKASNITRVDVDAFGKANGIRGASAAIDAVLKAVARWPEFAAAAGVPSRVRDACSGDFNRLR